LSKQLPPMRIMLICLIWLARQYIYLSIYSKYDYGIKTLRTEF
jgi:hypothetical protein